MNIPSEGWLSEIVTRSLPKSRALAADVGANRGEWSQALAEEFQSVIAVEPDERANASIVETPRVAVAPYAVAEKTGTADFYLRPSPDQNSLLEQHPIGAGGGAEAPVVESVTVAVVSMDDLFPEGCDFVKMDIEGGEVAALRGCLKTENWSRTVFVVECHDTFAEVASELQRLGKSVERVPHPFPGHHGHCWAVGKP